MLAPWSTSGMLFSVLTQVNLTKQHMEAAYDDELCSFLHIALVVH